MSRSLLPREHGAYGQLGAPLAVALAAGRPGLAAIALALGAIAAFLAHEPLLRLAARLGGRAQEAARRARRLERSLPGELVLATILAGAAVPAAIAAGVSSTLALWAWIAWSLGFGAVTCAVHGSVMRGARRDPFAARAVGLALVVAALALAVVGPAPVVAVVPLVVVAIALRVLAPSPRRLRRIGWTLMSATLLSGVWMAHALQNLAP